MASSDKQKVALASVIAQAWQDTDYKEKLLSDPAGTLSEAEVRTPNGAKPIVLQNTDRDMHVVVPKADDFEGTRADFITGLGHLLPLPDGVRLHFVQNSDDTHHLILPQAPDTANLSDDDVMNLAAASSGGSDQPLITSTAVLTSFNVNAGTTVNTSLAVIVSATVVAIVAT